MGRGPIFGGGAVLLVAAVVLVVLLVRGVGGSSAARPTPTLMPGQSGLVAGRPIDGVRCLGTEQLAYHIHQHIDLYLDGKRVDLPAYIGFDIVGTGQQETVKCLYYIHVHYEQTPNFIHVESPTKRIYTLGQMVDIWRATTNTTLPPNSEFLTRLLTAKRSEITAFDNLHRWTRNWRQIPLTEHATITINIGKPVVKPKLWTSWSEVD
jgi:hypothetical protein